MTKKSRKGFCRNPRGIFPNKVPGEFCGGFFGGFFWAFSLGKNRRKKSTKKSTAKFKSEFGSFAAKIHTAGIWPWKKRENPEKIGKVPRRQKKDKKGRTVPDREASPFEPPPLSTEISGLFPIVTMCLLPWRTARPCNEIHKITDLSNMLHMFKSTNSP